MNAYTTIQKVLGDLESLYQVSGSIEDDCRVVLDKQIVTKVRKSYVALAWLSDYLWFYQKAILDYSEYPGMRKAVEVLRMFEFRDGVTERAVREVNAVILMLNTMENRMDCENRMDYRFIRVFVMAVYTGDWVAASITAVFILRQLSLSLR